jgi:hypothetical protein
MTKDEFFEKYPDIYWAIMLHEKYYALNRRCKTCNMGG